VTVLNDTVACLMAAAGLSEARDAEGLIGIIVGTGTNMASFLPRGGIPKLGDAGPMAVNLENGNFSPAVLTETDDRVDAASGSPGSQRFEKALSGVYLGRVLAAERPDLGFDPAAGARGLTMLRDDPQAPADARSLASALLDRSADLAAAGLAGLAAVVLPRGGRLLVLAEGGLFWGAGGYAARVEATLSRLLGDRIPFSIRSRENANLVGSAVAALS
jgi:hexokinase